MSATCLATMAGGNNGSSTIEVPITAVSAIADSRASAVMVSGTGFREEMWPPTQSDSTPIAS